MIRDDFSANEKARRADKPSIRITPIFPEFHGWMFVAFTCLASGCAIVPVPATQETITSGIAVTEEEIKTIEAESENLDDIKLRFGNPLFDFGPGKILVYGWTINKGNVYWLLYNSFGSFPLNVSNLLIFTFDPENKLSKAGILEFNPSETVSGQVGEWLASVDLQNRYVGPRVEQNEEGAPVLFAYRPKKTRCPLLSSDSNTFKPAISVSGIFVGDLSIGEYIGAKLAAGEHDLKITISPLHQTEYMDRILRPAWVRVKIDREHPVFVETYLCTGNGRIEVKATVTDTNTMPSAARNMTPAW